MPGNSEQQPPPPNTLGDAYERLNEDEKQKVCTILQFRIQCSFYETAGYT